MTAEEIRKSLFEFQQGMQDAVKEDVKAAMQSVPAAAIGKIPLYLGEIAAQLAELNATLNRVVGQVSPSTDGVRVQNMDVR